MATHFKTLRQILSQKPIKSLRTKFTLNICRNLYKLIRLYSKNKLINNKLGMLKVLITNDVNEVQWHVLLERSSHLKNDSCSLDGLVLKYGETVGKKLFAERQVSVAVTKEKYIRTHSEYDWALLCNKKKSNLGKTGYIKKYGKKIGKQKWEEYLTKWKASIKSTAAKGGRKNGLTLPEMQIKWGTDEGYKRWKNRIDQRKHTLSMDGFIERFGKVNGVQKYYNHVEKMIGNCRGRNGGYSKISQNLFNAIVPMFSSDKQIKCKYFTSGGEQVFYMHETKKQKLIFVDFICGNAILEFDGDYWHSNSTVQERDKLKQDFLENRGYKILRIKEGDYLANKQQIIDKCIEFINKNYERT